MKEEENELIFLGRRALIHKTLKIFQKILFKKKFFFLFFVFLPFLGLLLCHLEVPRLGVQS